MTFTPDLVSFPLSNVPELTVSALSQALKQTVEDQFGCVRVRGEISGYRGPHSSGHVYFCLKDTGARLDAVIWKGAFSKMRIKPQEGLEVVATGRLTTYPGKSNYQILIDSLEPAGMGALMALLEERKKKLAAEGLFEAGRKRPIPFLPQTIGVITSPTGAVIRDILHRLADRFPRHVLVWPVRVQGETCAQEVAEAIHGFNALDPEGSIPIPDVLIVARGGGSLEDLWGFQEESVVRAAAQSTIPLISAIGHETDWSLLDYVADLRAPTPTAAAELCVPVRTELCARVTTLEARLKNGVMRYSQKVRVALQALVRALPQPAVFLAIPRQRVDHGSEKLTHQMRANLQRRWLNLSRVGVRLARHSPHAELVRRVERWKALAQRLNRVQHEGVHLGTRRLEALAKLLASLNYTNILNRGFVLVRDAQQRPVLRAVHAQEKGVLHLEFADGQVEVETRR